VKCSAAAADDVDVKVHRV